VRVAALGALHAVGSDAVGMTAITLGSLANVIFCIMVGHPAQGRAILAVADALDPNFGDVVWRPASEAEMQILDDEMMAWVAPPNGPVH
jgi:hypothetical protein